MVGAWFEIFESYAEGQGDGSMKEIADAGMLNDYMTKNQIENLFETKQLPFRLCEYDRGEILNNIRDSGSCLQFVVARLYSHTTAALYNVPSARLPREMEDSPPRRIPCHPAA